MNSAILNPLEAYEKTLKALHMDNVTRFFEALEAESGVNREENRKTVAEYILYKDNLAKLKKKIFRWKFLRVILCITLVLIPLVILKITPKIRALREEADAADVKAEQLLAEAYDQMLKLNNLFTDRDGLELIQKTVPFLTFDPCFTADREEDMKCNYDFADGETTEESTLDLVSGTYNDNPFLFEKKLVHTMGTETYHGYKTITWTETYRDANGKLQRRTRRQTLHATVEKPKPFYNTRTVLHYGAQAAPDLAFSRDASHLDRKSDKAIERHVKRGERRIKRRENKAIRKNEKFTGMANGAFDVLFDALDRTNEVQFRTLFTPLAQTNMVSLILSQTGYGDDFHFIKNRRMNKIISTHSQGRALVLRAGEYTSYSYDEIKNNFINKNAEFFKAVYFDFAPLLAIPAYQERPIHSLKPLPDFEKLYATGESEALANAMEKRLVVHPETKTEAILKSAYIRTDNKSDENAIMAYSYDIAKRVDVVSVYGGDGRFHNVSVPWDEYLPLQRETTFRVAKQAEVQTGEIMAGRNDLCIYK